MSAPAATAPGPTRRHVDHVMGLPVSLALRGPHAADPDDPAAREAWSAVMTSLRGSDALLSTWREDSWVSRLDRGEVSLAHCPPELAEVLALGEDAARDSGGAFTLRLPDAAGRVRLDPTGVAKGWALDRAARALEPLAGTDWCLSGGGDVLCRTRSRRTPLWRVGVEDPRDASRLLAVVPVGNGAVATSGTTHRGAHLLDGRTGRTARGVRQVTVVAPTLTEADVDATCAYALGPDALAWLRQRPGRSGLVVHDDGTTSTFATPR